MYKPFQNISKRQMRILPIFATLCFAASGLFAANAFDSSGSRHDHHASGSLENAGLIDLRSAKYNRGEDELKRALLQQERTFGLNDPHLIPVLNELGCLYLEIGRTNDARQYLNRALTVNGGKNKSLEADTLDKIARSYLAQGRIDKASDPARNALTIRQEVLQVGDLKIAESLNTVASLSILKNELKDAEQSASNAFTICEEIGQSALAEKARSLDLLARISIEKSLPRQGRPRATDALSIRKGLYGNNHPLVAESWLVYGDVNMQMKSFRMAEDAFKNAELILQSYADVKTEDRILSLYSEAGALGAQGKVPEGITYLQQAEPLYRALKDKDANRADSLRGSYLQALMLNHDWSKSLDIWATGIFEHAGSGVSPLGRTFVSACTKRGRDVPMGAGNELTDVMIWAAVPIIMIYLYMFGSAFKGGRKAFGKAGDKSGGQSTTSGTYWTAYGELPPGSLPTEGAPDPRTTQAREKAQQAANARLSQTRLQALNARMSQTRLPAIEDPNKTKDK
jgi:tetratricopeptide (TPR) repeat protein